MRAVAIAVCVMFLISASAPAGAQDSSRYSTWSDPTQPAANQRKDARLDDLIERLNKLVDEAEKSRAADPVFLQDLRALANGYTQPWSKTVLDDAFQDGNFIAIRHGRF